MRTYTVIGYFADNLQPWIEHVETDSASKAAEAAADVRCRDTEWDDHDNVVVVEVIEGKHVGVLCNSECLVGGKE